MTRITETTASTHVDPFGASGLLSSGPAESMPQNTPRLGTLEDHVREAMRGTAVGLVLDSLSTAIRIGTNRSDGNWTAVNQRKADWDTALLDLGFRQSRYAEDGQVMPPEEVALFEDRIASAKAAFHEAQKTMTADAKSLGIARAYYDEAISYLAANMEV